MAAGRQKGGECRRRCRGVHQRQDKKAEKAIHKVNQTDNNETSSAQAIVKGALSRFDGDVSMKGRQICHDILVQYAGYAGAKI